MASKRIVEIVRKQLLKHFYDFDSALFRAQIEHMMILVELSEKEVARKLEVREDEVRLWLGNKINDCPLIRFAICGIILKQCEDLLAAHSK